MSVGELFPLVRCPTIETGPHATYHELPHLQNPTAWQELAERAVPALCDTLRWYGLPYPHCSLCGPNCMIEPHLPSPKHFKRLWDKLQANHSINEEDFIQDFPVLLWAKNYPL